MLTTAHRIALASVTRSCGLCKFRIAGVALLLAGIGVYGVLDYSVLQRRRELGIRIAVGASVIEIATQVSAGIIGMVLTGVIVGVASGLILESRIEMLLYQVKTTDSAILALPLLTIIAMTLLSVFPAVIRGTRINPVEMLRAE